MKTSNTAVASNNSAVSDAQLIERLTRSLLARCDALATCSCEAGTIDRSFLSPAMARCNAVAADWMEAAGMSVCLDKGGNLRGVYEGNTVEAPRLIIGSHLDTVRAAGKYDGVLGVMMGIALVESLHGEKLSFAIEVIGFSDEEGVRFGLPFIGSREVVGTLREIDRALLDAEGVSLGVALDTFCQAHSDAVLAALSPSSRAYLEFHIEQGPILDDARQSLSAVKAITGQCRATLTFLGQAAHAGTTPMPLRRDAMMGAAEWMLAVESIAKTTPSLVATTGRVQCEPGGTNIVPGEVRCSLDLRTPDDDVRQQCLLRILDEAEAICEHRGLTVRYTIDMDQATVPLDQSLTQLTQHCVSVAGGQQTLMVSGAGHDAMIIAPHLPAAMIFLRSPGGISHNPMETVRSEDVADALRAGMRFLTDFPEWLKATGVRL